MLDTQGRRNGECLLIEVRTYEDFVGRVTECIKIDEPLDFFGKTEKSGAHDIFQVLSESLHVTAGSLGFCGCGPVDCQHQ